MKDQVVLITGASAGIGAALAREYARRGASVVLTARRTDKLEALATELRQGGTRALVVAADVTRDGDLEQAVARTLAEFGRLDVVLANAGFGINGSLAKVSLDDVRRQLETNVFGVLRTFYATKDALTQSRGCLGILGSVAGYISVPGTVAYSMSKYAVRALAEGLRAELRGLGISVTHIAPGFIESEIRHIDNAGQLHPHSKDPAPKMLVMPAPKAARQIVSAVAARRRELVVTGHGKVAVWLARHMSWLVSTVLGSSGKKWEGN